MALRWRDSAVRSVWEVYMLRQCMKVHVHVLRQGEVHVLRQCMAETGGRQGEVHVLRQGEDIIFREFQHQVKCVTSVIDFTERALNKHAGIL